MKHNEKVCRAHNLGSYAQGQGRSPVKGQNLVSAIPYFPKLASEVPSVLYLALELFGEKNRYPRKPMTLPFFIK